MYEMRTAIVENGNIVFECDTDFDEAIRVGFFRLKQPKDIDLSVTRNFASRFAHDEQYTRFRSLSLADGFFRSPLAQSVHFSLERDNWGGVYPKTVQRVGFQLAGLGNAILRAILAKFDLPPEIWSEATSGASEGEGSYYLVFRYYDPIISNKAFGLAEHTDWGFITVLDAIDDGLEAYIDGQWRALALEDGYLTINFGEPLHKLLPQVNASLHRVVTQTRKPRTSTVLFVDPRVGRYRRAGIASYPVGMVWDWDVKQRVLLNRQTTEQYFERMSANLYGTNSPFLNPKV